MKKLSLRRHESFFLRDGWTEKALNAITENNENIFRKNDGILKLGIGANMVKSLKYWMIASKIIKANNTGVELTTFGKLLLEYDQYMEDRFSWFLLHYFLVSNFDDSPVFSFCFNKIAGNQLDEKYVVDSFLEEYKDDFKFINEDLLEEDFNMFVKSYSNNLKNEKDGNPENNLICPLSQLGLLIVKDNSKKNNSNKPKIYTKTMPKYKSLDCLIVYFVLSEIYAKDEVLEFDINDSFEIPNSPVKIFSLDKSSYHQYLDELKRMNWININRTAGINTVYIKDKWYSLSDIFQHHFGEKINDSK